MNVSQRAWPFILLILFMTIGLPMIDHTLKVQQNNVVIEIQVEQEQVVAIYP